MRPPGQAREPPLKAARPDKQILARPPFPFPESLPADGWETIQADACEVFSASPRGASLRTCVKKPREPCARNIAGAAGLGFAQGRNE